MSNMKTVTLKRDEDKNSIGAMIAAAAGAVVITGVAVGATIALRNKSTRKTAEKILMHVKDQAVEYAKTLKASSKTGEIKKITADTKKIIKKRIK